MWTWIFDNIGLIIIALICFGMFASDWDSYIKTKWVKGNDGQWHQVLKTQKEFEQEYPDHSANFGHQTLKTQKEMDDENPNFSNQASSQQNFQSFSFWNGQKGLALTFWGFFVGGNILFNAATIIFADNPTLIMVNLILFILWNVLAVMGVFNAANIYKAEKMKQGLPYTAATVAKVLVVLLILSAIGNNIPR